MLFAQSLTRELENGLRPCHLLALMISLHFISHSLIDGKLKRTLFRFYQNMKALGGRLGKVSRIIALDSIMFYNEITTNIKPPQGLA